MSKGVIKKIMQEKGFGFISPEEGPDVFFHVSATNGTFDSLTVGQEVTFDVEQSEKDGKGPKAVNVSAA